MERIIEHLVQMKFVQQDAKRIDSLINLVNKKLSPLQLSKPVWPSNAVIQTDEVLLLPDVSMRNVDTEFRATILGYCQFADGWQLAANEVTVRNEDPEDEEEVGNCTVVKCDGIPHRLIESPREEKLRAILYGLDHLLRDINDVADVQLEHISEMEGLAESL
jgi:hypothetical protein